jgi:hypothetical protein
VSNIGLGFLALPEVRRIHLYMAFGSKWLLHKLMSAVWHSAQVPVVDDAMPGIPQLSFLTEGGGI